MELRNEIARLVVADEAAAGGTWLIDERWRRRRVAIVSGGSADVAQPLLSPVYYIKRALAPFAEIREAKPGESDPILSLLAEKPSVLALADMSVPPGPTRDKLNAFVESGGVLIRFAGTRLAAGDDDLTPTTLRRGGRTLGGALSWETPKHIAPFEDPSPFVGLAAPGEVTVSRQVLAEPEPGLAAKTWARLADGTPLVTAVRRGKGLIVLFHVTADTTWSNLPISGLFVEMLRRVVAQSGAAPSSEPTSSKSVATLAPYRTLDGFGVLGAPPANAQPIPETFSGAGDAAHPPGFYGAADSLIAVNAMAPGDVLSPADYSGLSVRSGGLDVVPPVELKPWLLLAALTGFLIDALASLWLGRPQGFVRRTAPLVLALAVLAGAGLANRAEAQPQSAPSAGRSERGAGDASGLCRQRRRGGRRDVTARPRDARADARSAHIGGDRRADRAQSRARRTRVLSADLLADRRRAPAAAFRGGRADRQLHEERRHRDLRHPRRADRAARRARRRRRRNGCARCSRASTFPNLSPSRAITSSRNPSI